MTEPNTVVANREDLWYPPAEAVHSERSVARSRAASRCRSRFIAACAAVTSGMLADALTERRD
jgi:hypothetical protein